LTWFLVEGTGVTNLSLQEAKNTDSQRNQTAKREQKTLFSAHSLTSISFAPQMKRIRNDASPRLIYRPQTKRYKHVWLHGQQFTLKG
jgi:hypothetical protein